MISTTSELIVGAWRADRDGGELVSREGVVRVEPKVMDLLFVLAAERGRVVTRERLLEALWPGLVVGEDALARTVFKLRQALGDDAKAPRYVETVAKRGYRLVAEVADRGIASTTHHGPAPIAESPHVRTDARPSRGVARPRSLAAGVVLAGALLALALLALRSGPAGLDAVPDARVGVSPALVSRADDFYFRFSRADNESAIALYERVLGLDADDPAALAGLANALTQRAVRWPEPDGGVSIGVSYTRLGDALAAGHLSRDPARRQLARARRLAERSVERAPRSAASHKALGFVRSAQGELDAALETYGRAIDLDPDAWGAMINVGDVLEIAGRAGEALPWFERAYEAMSRTYGDAPAQVGPWHAALGVLIADKRRSRGDATGAEVWYRRVLAISPLHLDATRGLAALLRDAGDGAAADRLCAELSARLARPEACADR